MTMRPILIFTITYSQPEMQETASDIPIVKAFGISIYPKDIQSLIIESKSNDRWIAFSKFTKIPVCFKKHWSLVLIKVNEKKVRYFDSLAKQKQAIERKSLLEKFITKIITVDARQKQLDLEINEWIFRAESNVQQETFSYDCGLFTCSFARSIINGEWSSKETGDNSS